MNPSMMNYLQSQQNGQAQATPQPQSPVFNPFDNGIKSAIESARVSLDMTEKQQDKAMRRSMLSFANAYGQEPRQKGFMANFGSMARSLSPAILEHDNVEDMSLKENNNLANQILAYQAAEQNRLAHEEDKQYNRAFDREKFEEQKRYHNNKLNSSPSDFGSPLGDEFVPISSKAELTPYLKSKNAFGSVLNATDHIEKAYEAFRKKYKDNNFDPMGRGSTIINPVKGLAGRFFNNKELREEANDRETFNSMLNEYVAASERELKGGGSTGPQILQYFQEQKIYPSLKDDNPELFKAKLDTIKRKIEDGYKAANLSLKYKAHIDPFQVEALEERLSPSQPQKSLPQESLQTPKITEQEGGRVIMQDARGKRFPIPVNKVQEALDDKEDPLTIVKE